MVSRLIKHQEVGLCNEHVGKRHTFLLTTTELSHGLLQVGDVQLCKDLSSFKHLLGITLMIKTGIKYSLFGVETRRLFKESQLQVASIDDRA